MSDGSNRLAPIAIGLIRFRTAAEGGRRSGAPPGPYYVTTIRLDTRQENEPLPLRVLDPEGHLTAGFGFEEKLRDGWIRAEVGFIAPELIRDSLVKGSRWLVMEGPLVVGEFEVTKLLGVEKV
jgi:hypothetical protein